MTYEYLCVGCAHSWEAEQSISSPPLKTCPACGQDTAKRQVSGGAGFILKGSGWYADLYSSAKPAKKEEGGESKPAKASENTNGSSASNGDSKSTAASPSAPAPSASKAGGAAAS